ncbi:hypothetical protein [Halorubrum sp. PV6]|uniref:hypothetical protein n=1 Tax=Halorubrum sp. PV6 TaxID=634157 RepID=UPI000F8D6C1B|nr:hypothetical protein [Halorubrum sp. PV6]
MTSESPTQILDGIHQSILRKHELGDQRIKAWYCDEYEPPEELQDIETPPHQRLFERSAKLADFAASNLAREEVRFGDPDPIVELIAYGVAVEILLSGVHLKVDSEKFVKILEKNKKTPSYCDCKQILIADITSKMPSEQLGILIKTLEIIRDQRNNEAHLGYHTYQHSHLDGLVLELIYILLKIYSESDIPELESLESHIKEARSNITNPRMVTFDLDAIFEE